MDDQRRDSAIAMGDEAQSSVSQSLANLALSPGNSNAVDDSQNGANVDHVTDYVAVLEPSHIRPADVSPLANTNHHEIAEQVKSIYEFYVRIGVLDDKDMDFGPRNFVPSQHNPYAFFDDDAIALLELLPWPTSPINFDWNSPALSWSKVPLFHYATGQLYIGQLKRRKHLPFYLSPDLKPSEIPLTEFKPGSLGFYWVINARTGIMRRIYLTDPIEEEDRWVDEDEDDASTYEKQSSEEMDMEGPAVELLSEYLTRLESLETIPIRLWVESKIKPGFVDKTESVYEDVKAKLYAYGWPYAFRREEWVRNLPGLVARWKTQKVAHLESMEERTTL